MNLTVLICTHNRSGLLSRTLRYLNAADRPEGYEIEILVAANACTDGTEQLLKDYPSVPGQIPLRWIAVPQPGKSHALNQAIPQVTSDLTVFVDDDHRVHQRLFLAIQALDRRYPETDLFCGRILPDWDGSEPPWAHDTGPYRIYPLPVPRYDQGDEAKPLAKGDTLPGGGNWLIRTRLFPRVDPFSADFGPVGHDLGGAEDLEWLRRALKTGAQLRYDPDLVQYHYVDGQRLRIGYLMRKAYERSCSTVRLTDSTEIPRYAYRKAGQHLLNSVFCIHWPKRRFYLVRFAAALGEIKGFYLAAKQRKRPFPDPGGAG